MKTKRFQVLIDIDGVGSAWVTVSERSARSARSAALRTWGGRALMVQLAA